MSKIHQKSQKKGGKNNKALICPIRDGPFVDGPFLHFPVELNVIVLSDLLLCFVFRCVLFMLVILFRFLWFLVAISCLLLRFALRAVPIFPTKS